MFQKLIIHPDEQYIGAIFNIARRGILKKVLLNKIPYNYEGFMVEKIKISALVCIFMFVFCLGASSEVISGKVKQDNLADKKKSMVVDSVTQKPITGAAISIPSAGYRTTSGSDGTFELNTQINDKAILSVQKDGYRPFSLTIDTKVASNPLKLGIEKSKAGDITIESDLCHLGDDVFSETSANSGEFKGKSAGAFFSKKFSAKPPRPNEEAIIIIGSVIGLDTKMARELGQNQIAHVYSSPAEVYFNGEKIGELNINGDNQEISIPRQLLRDENDLTIKTGRNLFQHAYIDYDDIEIANIRFEIKDRPTFANK